MARERVVMSWSGGKDSAMALREVLADDRYEVVALLTSLSAEFRRISHHGVREELLDAQADALGLRLDKLWLPACCSNDDYRALMRERMDAYLAEDVRTVVHGDLFLEDIRAFRERNLAEVGMRALFPIWGRDTAALARSFVRDGWGAILSFANRDLGVEFAGRHYDDVMLDDLPAGIDPCGEYGEFHTYVFRGPILRREIPVAVGERVTRETGHYAELLPA